MVTKLIRIPSKVPTSVIQEAVNDYAKTHSLQTKSRKFIEDFYLTYTNDYLTSAKIAEHEGISEELAKALIAEGKKIHQGWHPEA